MSGVIARVSGERLDGRRAFEPELGQGSETGQALRCLPELKVGCRTRLIPCRKQKQ